MGIIAEIKGIRLVGRGLAQMIFVLKFYFT